MQSFIVGQRGYGATVARLTPDQKVGSSNLSALAFYCCRASAQYDNEKVTHICGSFLRATFGAPAVWVTTVGHFVGHTLVCYVGHFVVVFLFLGGRMCTAPSSGVQQIWEYRVNCRIWNLCDSE